MSAREKSPVPMESDIHLCVFLRGMRFDYLACATAARRFVQEHARLGYVDAVEMLHDDDDAARLPRLPCERLFLLP
ncbi:hypothetical protein [Nocardia callitridis]|uniref:hypothetical protein n=1 Tax=Nocardia callitridis TaxID=648753 RepID=UPI0031EFF34A